MKKYERSPRRAISYDTHVLGEFEQSRGAWFETKAQVREGLKWGRKKRALLQWVRLQMLTHLTERERHCVEMHYFEALTYAQMGIVTNTNASSTFRAVKRALRKLRVAAAEDTSWQSFYPVRRR